MEYTLRPYQEEAREAVEKEWENGNKKTLLVMATGCHKKGELLMLSNGDLKPVEAISKSDRLMGSDGNPRRILAIHHGVEDMYKITPKRGNDPFVVTKDHVLTLINNLDEYIDITVEDFLKLKKVRQTNLYLKRSDAIKEFEGQTNKLNSDLSEAYILGVFYNNSSASKQCVRVALPNETIAKVFKKWCKKHKYEISEMTDNSICLKKGKNNEEKPYDYALKYGFADMKRKDSSIPDFIKKAPLEFRMNFLAATIDICGTKNGSAFQVNKSSRQFAEDLIFMARSCGLSAYLSKSRKVQKSGEIYEIYNVTIGGEVNKLPTIVKKNHLESQMNALKTRFDIEYVGRGEYFGFTVDGDNRYLLNGFTLTHNCGKTVCFSQIIKDQLSKGDKVLVIAHREELLNQAAEKIESMTGLKTAREKGQETAIGSESKIVIASIRTLQGDKRLNQFKRDEFGTIVVDEAHHIMADGYQKVMDYFEDAKVLGVTATADRGDKKDLGNYFDSIAYEYGIKQAVEEGYLCPLVAQTIPIDIDISNVKTSQGDYQLGELSTAIDPYLDEIAKQISNICRNRKTIIFTPLVETAKKMRDLLNKYGMNAAEIDGSTSDRGAVLKNFKENKFNVLTNPILLCLDEKTEVLTSGGFKGVDDISWDDEIANWNFDNSVFFAKPKNIIKRDLEKDENMISVESQMINFRVTDKHNLVCLDSTRTKYIKKEANKVTIRDIFPTCGIAKPKTFVLSDKNSKEYIPTKKEISSEKYNLKHRNGYSEEEAIVEANKRIKERKSLRYLNPEELSLAQCKFIGFYLAEGHTQKLIRNGVEFRFSQAESYPKIIEWIDNVLKEMGIHYLKKYKKIDKKKNPNKHNYFNYSLCRGTGYGPQARKGLYPIEPYLKRNGTELFWGLNEEQFDALLEGYWYGDGDHKQALNGFPKSIHLSETSKELLELFCAIGSCRGWRCSMFTRKPNKSKHNIQYALSMQKGMKRHMNEVTKIKKEKYKKEKVWCVTTDSGNIITRRNGRVMVMGNCEGYDEPSADCMVMLRPTQVRSLFCQAVGRITRLYPGKNNALILDFLWLTQKHNLIRPAALFNDDQDVIDAVTEEVNSNGGEVDLMMADRQARKRVIKQREESLARQLEEQRRKTAKFVDPLQFAYSVESQEIIQYQPMFKVDYKKPTKEQIEWLFDHGINADEIDSYGKAQRIKDTLMERYRRKLSTPKQIRFLEKRGFRRVGLWQFDQASEMIDKIANNNWFVPHGINPKTYVPRVETKKIETIK